MLLWLRSVTDLVATAAVTRLREVERVRQPVGPTAPDALPTPARPARGRTFVALTPIWVLLAVFVLRPRFLDPLFGNPPGIAGMPAGVMLLAAMILWTLLGAWVIRARRSELGTLLTLFVFAIPATFAVILGPAPILIVQNLG